MTTATIPAEIAATLQVHDDAMTTYRAIERYLGPLLAKAESIEQETKDAAQGVNDALVSAEIDARTHQMISFAAMDARWVARNLKNVLAAVRNAKQMTADGRAELQEFMPGEPLS